jgi:hypothetical protein
MASLPLKMVVTNADGSESECDEFPGATCCICGQKATAMWQGASEVFVCPKCAVGILPKLIADAIISDRTNYTRVLEVKNRMDKAFWEAVACRALSLGRDR